jgi:hypothetical protein
MKQLFFVLLCVISFSYSYAESRVFTCITEKHTIFIDQLDSSNYRYRSWNKPKASDTKPDMELKSKDVKTEGTGACRHTDFSFKTGKVVFIVDDNVECVEKAPPKNVIGNLSVLINDEVKSQYYCIK